MPLCTIGINSIHTVLIVSYIFGQTIIRPLPWIVTMADEDLYERLEGPKIDRRTTMQMVGAAGFTGLSATLAGCTGSGNGGGSNGSKQTQKKSGGKIKAGWLTNEIVNLDPHKVDKGVQMQVVSNVFNGLIAFNKKGEMVGDVAKDWTIKNKTTYEFKIRKGITFHNGEPLDASAVKRSLNRLRNFEKSPHISKVKPIKSIEAPDKTTVRIKLKTPVAPFIAFMTCVPGRAGAIVSTKAIEKMGTKKYNRKPIGSGPFKVGARETGSSLTLKKFNDYWATKNGNQLPYLDEVQIRLIPSPSTLWSALKTGSIKYASSLPGQFGNRAKRSSQIEVRGVSPGNWQSIALLCNNPAKEPHTSYAKIAAGNAPKGAKKWKGKTVPTANKNVRKAISKALDRQEIVKKGYYGWAKPANSLFNPTIGWLYEKKPDPGQYQDVKKAKQLLNQAGYTGNPRFKMNLLGVPEDKRAMTVIKSQLSDVGIKATLNIQQPSTYWTTIYEYSQIGSMYGGATDIDPWMSWFRQLHTPEKDSSAGGWQKNLYSNKKFDKLLEKSYKTPKQGKRKEYIKKAEEIFIEEAPYAMVAHTLLPKPSTKDLNGMGVQIGLSNFHTAYLAE